MMNNGKKRATSTFQTTGIARYLQFFVGLARNRCVQSTLLQ